MTHAIPTPYEDLLREILEENKDAIAADARVPTVPAPAPSACLVVRCVFICVSRSR